MEWILIGRNVIEMRMEIDVVEKSKGQQTSCQWNIFSSFYTNEPGFYYLIGVKYSKTPNINADTKYSLNTQLKI